MTELKTTHSVADGINAMLDACDVVEVDLGKSENVCRFDYADMVKLTLANLVADIEQQQMDSLARLIARQGIAMTEQMAEMFASRLSICRTDAKSQVANVLRQLCTVSLPT